MLGDEVVVADVCCFGEAGGPTAEHVRRGRLLRRLEIIEPLPVLFPMLEQGPPRLEAVGTFLAREVVEDEDAGVRDAVFVAGLLHVGQDLGLGDEEFDAGGADGVGEFVGLVGGVGAGEDAAEGDDAVGDDGVVDLGGELSASALVQMHAPKGLHVAR